MATQILAIGGGPPYFWHDTDTLAAVGMVVVWSIYMTVKFLKRSRLVLFDWSVTFIAAISALALISHTFSSSTSTATLVIVLVLIAAIVAHALWRFRNWFRGPNQPR